MAANLRVAGGVGGMAEATTQPSMLDSVRGKWLDPSQPTFWAAVIYGSAVLWLVWVRFVFRGAAL